MRTTVDIPEPLHRIAASLAQHTGRSFSQTVVALMERGLQTPAQAGASTTAAAADAPRHLPGAKARRSTL